MTFRRRTVFAIASIAVIGIFAFIWAKEFRVSLDPAKTLPITLLGDATAFFQRINEDPYMGHDGQRQDIGAFFFEAPASASRGPDGYTLAIESADCSPVTLPTGRMVAIDHVGLWITGASVNLPMEPVDFDAARALAVDIMDAMSQAGWDRVKYRPDMSAERIAEVMGGRHTLAEFKICGDPGTLASVSVRDFTNSSPGYSIPPAAVVAPQPEDAAVRYLIVVNIMARTFDEGVPNLLAPVEARVHARREAVTGDPYKPIPLATWLQDPDWKP